MKKIKNIVIIDLDGVIINSKENQKLSYMNTIKHYYSNFDFENSFKDFLSLTGSSLENTFKKLGFRNVEEMVKLYEKTSNETLHMIKIIDGIIDLLFELYKNGYICTICTGKYRNKTIRILEHFKIDCFFNYIICSDDLKYPKPNSECINKINDFYNCKNYEYKYIMIGDGVNDIKCAKNANIKSIVVSWGFTDISILKKENPDYIAYTIKDLNNIILRSDIFCWTE